MPDGLYFTTYVFSHYSDDYYMGCEVLIQNIHTSADYYNYMLTLSLLGTINPQSQRLALPIP